jgi:LysM repeat protein
MIVIAAVLFLVVGGIWWGWSAVSPKPEGVMYASPENARTHDGAVTSVTAPVQRPAEPARTTETPRPGPGSGLAPLGTLGTLATDVGGGRRSIGANREVAMVHPSPEAEISRRLVADVLISDPATEPKSGSGSGPATTAPSSSGTTATPKSASVVPAGFVLPPIQPPTTQMDHLPDLKAPDVEFSEGMKLIEQEKLVEGRQRLSRLLTEPKSGISASDAQTVRDTLASINEKLVFSTEVTTGDPLVESYVVQPPDLLSKLAPHYHIPAALIEYVNHVEARKLPVGKKLKLIKGPFHAVVHKSDYRMDMFLDDPTTGQRIYIRSFKVGLGEDNSTPVGTFIVKQGGKVATPSWSNPKTHEYYEPGNVKNPIGKFWLALDGQDEHTRDKEGYGIHGTVDPDSIGKQESMGCVRLRDDDIALVYKMLTEVRSTVLIMP